MLVRERVSRARSDSMISGTPPRHSCSPPVSTTRWASTRLGHRTIAITLDLYTHAVQSLDQQAAEAMQTVLRRGTGS